MAESSEASQKPICSEAAQLIQKVLTAPEPDCSDAWQELLDHCIRPIARLVAKRLGWTSIIGDEGADHKSPPSAKRRRAAHQKVRALRSGRQKDLPRKRFRISRLAAEFRDSYALHVYQGLGQYDTSKGAFSTWCYRVLYNWAMDLARAEQRRRQSETLDTDRYEVVATDRDDESTKKRLEEIAVARDAQPVWQLVAEEESLNPRQIAILEKMPVLRRVIACAAAGWAWRIPPDTWRQWVEAAGLEPDFPPPELAKYDKPLDRLRFLAKHCGEPYSSIRQHWYRAMEVLPKLFQEGESP